MSNVTPIRVTGTVTTVPSGTQDVNIVSPNPLPVVGVSISAIAVGGAVNVTDNTQTTIATFTAVATTRITRIGVSGTLYGKYQLYKNTILIETKRTSPDRTLDFLFTNPLSLITTDVLEMKVTHYQVGVLGDFESTIYGV